MSFLAFDLGGTKLASGIFSDQLDLIEKKTIPLEGLVGKGVGDLIAEQIDRMILSQTHAGFSVNAIGISIPGIYSKEKGTVWAPNIPGWEDFPLIDFLSKITRGIPVFIDNDRACYIRGESTIGKARDCNDAIFIAVGTGIGAGILANGNVLRGAHDIAGAIGWMALDRPFSEKYISSGCFESMCSGEGIVKVAEEKINADELYSGQLNKEGITTHDVFAAFEENDPVAGFVINQCIELWGMALANMISIFNPQMVIFGGGVFGPAAKFIPQIVSEAKKWAQPVSINQVEVVASALGQDAGLHGAACMAMKNLKNGNAL